MKNLSGASLLKSIGNLFRRYHMTLFIVLIVGCLAGAVVYLNDMLSGAPKNDGYVSPLDVGIIDQTTLDRIKELHTSDQIPPTLVLPAGRLNPFAE